MVQKHVYKSDQEWMELIQECRTSGLTDKDWCEQHHLHRSTLYYQIRRLKKKACEIPEAQHLDRKKCQQAVVPLTVQDNGTSAFSGNALLNNNQTSNIGRTPEPAVRIHFREVWIELLNGADSQVVRDTLSVLYKLC